QPSLLIFTIFFILFTLRNRSEFGIILHQRFAPFRRASSGNKKPTNDGGEDSGCRWGKAPIYFPFNNRKSRRLPARKLSRAPQLGHAFQSGGSDIGGGAG